MNNTFPKVSVTIATHNRASLLGRALDSVFRQTYPNIEVVLLDDCSEDNTQEVITSYVKRYPNIRAFREKAGGMIQAVQQTAQKAQGKYVAPLDDDDFWSDPEKIALQVEFLESHPEYVAVGGGIIRIDEQGRERARYLYPETDEAIRKSMLWYTPISGVTIMFRRSTWEAVGGYDSKVLYADDWDLAARLGKKGKLYNLPRYISTYMKSDVRWSVATARRLERASFEIRRKYRKDYPGFWMGSTYGVLLYLFTFVPGQRFWKPSVSRVWHAVYRKLF